MVKKCDKNDDGAVELLQYEATDHKLVTFLRDRYQEHHAGVNVVIVDRVSIQKDTNIRYTSGYIIRYDKTEDNELSKDWGVMLLPHHEAGAAAWLT
ncbi:hypothetical protein SAMD00019534_101610 [Acytostelium subglobosum LB1]|uniref:hypothetical protein n=1 Tax=Acytostelium subglobosum LB1 TaxID=1410327 RepID=UPI000644E083|nr:hypothetical protein SAMD00019534_101610 [Acytostelium subglobosum LB1]GAM26986.1 hypothetical protein SAMD00019534_101610 [Acytostelium subglobosum LB1]|eukprot:XP_012749866.1 hypothetical protein SAMD00019534_101610 [Acytostelium subglobosum LB1]